jgi:1-acyl-sn-glycerol-3-phosphate acyltransferase
MGTILFILCFITCTIAWDLFAKLRFLFVRSRYGDFWNDFFRMMSRYSVLLARIYVRLRFIPESAVPAAELPDRFLLITNHQSLADIAILVCAFPGRDLKYAAKKELKYGIPSVSVGLRLGNHAFVNRRGGFSETMRSLNRLLNQPGDHICPVVFPEGTRSRTGRLGRFHSAGVRYILEHSDLPVVSAAVEGAEIPRFLHPPAGPGIPNKNPERLPACQGQSRNAGTPQSNRPRNRCSARYLAAGPRRTGRLKEDGGHPLVGESH